jgi:hypothetical protein
LHGFLLCNIALLLRLKPLSFRFTYLVHTRGFGIIMS